jgi:DNA replication and repair protein RecF
VLLESLWLSNFRNHRDTQLELSPGVTVVSGSNGQGKTNLLEAMGFVATLQSFRGATTDTLISVDSETSIVRAQLQAERALLVEIELSRGGRTRMQLNKQRVTRARDLTRLIHVTVFSPDDLVLIKGGPAVRRDYLDDLLAQQSVRDMSLRADFDKVLRQRNSLLKQAKGRLSPEIADTLAVFDLKFVESGEALVAARVALLQALQPEVTSQFRSIAVGDNAQGEITLVYLSAWRDQGLSAALANSRSDDLRRGLSTVGPHRDDIAISVNELSTRSHASQGEQRSCALALRLGGQRLSSLRSGVAPLMLLDDVFSELDEHRAAALVANLPEGQTVLTTTGLLPPGVQSDHSLFIHDGVVTGSQP